MLKLSKQIIKTFFILLMIFGIASAKEVNFDNYVDSLNQNFKIDSTNINTRYIIEKYCSSLLDNDLSIRYDEELKYKPQESVFLYILCTNVNKQFEKKFEEIKEYLTGTSFKKLGIIQYSPDKKIDYCSPAGTNLNDCNIPSQISKIFKIIINEYTNIKQASMYGITEKIENSSQIEDFANQFGNQHFFIEICNSKKTGLTYSKSCNIVKSYIQSSSKILESLKIINKDEIYKKKKKENLIYNGIIRLSDTSFIDFTNTIYNELIFFNLFVNYYNNLILNNNNLMNINIINKDSRAKKQTSKFNNELQRIEKSISTTTRNLRDMYIAFPLHIGLVMYYEDVLKLGKELEGISYPIYNLYDKFRNVQKPNK